MKRVTGAWHPDRSVVFINRHKDKILVLDALSSAGKRGYETASELLERRFPNTVSDEGIVPPEEFAFPRDETDIIMRSLVLAAQEMQQQPRKLHQVEGLVGQLVVNGAGMYYPVPRMS